MARQTWTATARGIGKPDFTRLVSSGRTRAGLTLAYNQSIQVFGLTCSAIASPYVWVQAPLAIGGNAHMINHATGVPTPFLVPVGYRAYVLEISGESLEDMITWLSLDGFRVGAIAAMTSGGSFWRNQIVSLDTQLIDPMAATPHIVDIVVYNLGGGALEGALMFTAIFEAVGTEPLSDKKTVYCKFCGHQWEVLETATTLTCPNCGELIIVISLSTFGRTP